MNGLSTSHLTLFSIDYLSFSSRVQHGPEGDPAQAPQDPVDHLPGDVVDQGLQAEEEDNVEQLSVVDFWTGLVIGCLVHLCVATGVIAV